MATLKKMTRMGADVRQIARLLQAKAPEGHMLAYITPEEAELLKSQGGSGKPHADTGVPSFAPDFDYSPPESVAPAPELSSSPVASVEAPAPEPVQNVETPVSQDRYNMGVGGGYYGVQPDKATAQPYSAGQGFQADASRLYEMPSLPTVIQTPPALTQEAVKLPEQGQTFSQKAEDVTKFLDKNASLVKLLGLGATGLGGLYRGRQGAKQAEALRGELGTLGQDYRRQGQELLTKAQTGELTAPQQQQLQAAQAQLSQQATARGGVGSMQAATQIEALRQQYVSQNMDRALQLLGIADQYQANAIKAGYSANKDAQSSADRFYAAMGQFLVPQSQQTTPRG